MLKKFTSLMAILFAVGISPALASEADLVVPNIKDLSSNGYTLLLAGIGVAVLGLLFGLWMFARVKKSPVHQAMASVGNTIFETCKTYLIQQGKFLLGLEVIIGLCIAFYFGYLQKMGLGSVLTILGW